MDRLTEYLEETIEAIESDQAAAYDVEYSVSQSRGTRACLSRPHPRADVIASLPCAESRES